MALGQVAQGWLMLTSVNYHDNLVLLLLLLLLFIIIIIIKAEFVPLVKSQGIGYKK